MLSFGGFLLWTFVLGWIFNLVMRGLRSSLDFVTDFL